MCGGVFVNAAQLQQLFGDEMRKRLPDADVTLLSDNAAEGALGRAPALFQMAHYDAARDSRFRNSVIPRTTFAP
jgi:hypothetical protein